MNIRGLQLVLALIKYPINVDGILGPNTVGAFRDLAERLPREANELLELCGITEPIWISKDDVCMAIKSRKEPRDVESFLHRVVELENHSLDDGYIIDMEPPYVGLGQFDKATWRAVTDVPFSSASNMSQSLEALVSLYVENKRSFDLEFDGIFTEEIAYLYHNQGASASAEYLKTGQLRYPKQSDNALALFARI